MSTFYPIVFPSASTPDNLLAAGIRTPSVISCTDGRVSWIASPRCALPVIRLGWVSDTRVVSVKQHWSRAADGSRTAYRTLHPQQSIFCCCCCNCVCVCDPLWDSTKRSLWRLLFLLMPDSSPQGFRREGILTACGSSLACSAKIHSKPLWRHFYKEKACKATLAVTHFFFFLNVLIPADGEDWLQVIYWRRVREKM